MNLKERFQMHCQWCFRRFEGDTHREVLAKTEEHEQDEHADKISHR